MGYGAFGVRKGGTLPSGFRPQQGAVVSWRGYWLGGTRPPISAISPCYSWRRIFAAIRFAFIERVQILDKINKWISAQKDMTCTAICNLSYFLSFCFLTVDSVKGRSAGLTQMALAAFVIGTCKLCSYKLQMLSEHDLRFDGSLSQKSYYIYQDFYGHYFKHPPSTTLNKTNICITVLT